VAFKRYHDSFGPATLQTSSRYHTALAPHRGVHR
jgi:hypothetical protein